VLDRERILTKLDEIDGYVRDLRTIAPQGFAEYRQIEKKRACERLLQIAVECVIDICNLFVAGLRKRNEIDSQGRPPCLLSGVGFFAGEDLHFVKRAWMPAFAGMTEKRLAGSAVIPAQAGIQENRGNDEVLRKTPPL
jgi:hypothetical protein